MTTFRAASAAFLERESVEPLVAGVAEIRAGALLVRGQALEQLRQLVRVGCFEARVM